MRNLRENVERAEEEAEPAALLELTRKIREEANEHPEAYILETIVPEGGE